MKESNPLQIVATAPADVQETEFEGNSAVRFVNPVNRIAGALEEFGELLSSVLAAQCDLTCDSFDGQVILLPSIRRWVYVAQIPAEVPDELVHQVVRAFVNKMIVQDTPSEEGSNIDPAVPNVAAKEKMESAAHKLLGKRGGDPVPDCNILRGNRVLVSVRGTFRTKPNLTQLREAEVPFEGFVDGYKCQPREAYLTITKDGSLKEVKRIANWAEDALGDKVASLASTPSEKIRVAGVLGVTHDAKGRSVYEVKSISSL